MNPMTTMRAFSSPSILLSIASVVVSGTLFAAIRCLRFVVFEIGDDLDFQSFRTILRPTLVSHIKSGLEVHGVWPHVVASANQHLSNVRSDQAQKFVLVVVQRAFFDLQEQSYDFTLRVAVKFCGCVQKLKKRLDKPLARPKWFNKVPGDIVADGKRLSFACDYNGKAWLFVRHLCLLRLVRLVFIGVVLVTHLRDGFPGSFAIAPGRKVV